MEGLYGGEFAGYRIASSEEHDTALREAVVAVDANVLLDLYRFRERTSTDLLSIMRSLGDRLVVPHQALREFWRHRARSQASPHRATRSATDQIGKSQRSLDEALRTWAKAVGTGHDELDGLIVQVNDFVVEITQQLESALPERDDHPVDPVLHALEEILEGKVTDPLSADEYEDCLAEARRRIDAEEPPGYLDALKEEDGPEEGGAGDYLVWFQATRHAQRRDQDLILVTRDEKPDWWWRQNATFIGPRPELAKEFVELTGRKFFLMRPTDLLVRAAVLDVEVDEASTSDVERVDADRQADGVDDPDHEAEASDVPWTEEALSSLLAVLDAQDTVRAAALRLAARSSDGKVSREDVYRVGGFPPERVLRGFTRPYLRFTESLQYEGRIPRGVAPIFVAEYPHGPRTTRFRVPPEVPELLANIEGGSSDPSASRR